jgi:hypothetical protein
MTFKQVMSVFIYYILTRQKRIDEGEPTNFNGIILGNDQLDALS